LCSQIDRVLRTIDVQPIVVERVASQDLMLTLVAAGYGLGFTSTAQIEICHHPKVIVRPLAGRSPLLTTYLLRPDAEPSAQLSHFIDRVNPVETPARDEPP
jgi:DNA-binding transcriptional LysR family regulator